MNGPRRFDPSELRGAPGEPPSEAQLADALAAARVLETQAAADRIGPTAGFEDRVMAAIAREPAPRLVIRPGTAVRGGRLAGFAAAVRDSWGIATGQGRPIAVRAQALGFLAIVVVAAGSLGTVTAVGVGSLLQPGPIVAPSVAPISTISPSFATPSAMPSSPSPSTSPSPSPTPTQTSEPRETAEPTATDEPTATPEGTDDGASSTNTPEPTDTSEPEDTPKPGETQRPSETPASSDDHGGGSGDG